MGYSGIWSKIIYIIHVLMFFIILYLSRITYVILFTLLFCVFTHNIIVRETPKDFDGSPWPHDGPIVPWPNGFLLGYRGPSGSSESIGLCKFCLSGIVSRKVFYSGKIIHLFMKKLTFNLQINTILLKYNLSLKNCIAL